MQTIMGVGQHKLEKYLDVLKKSNFEPAHIQKQQQNEAQNKQS